METWHSWLLRLGFNFFPVFRSTGAWITYVSGDFRTIKLKLGLFWQTRNYVGTLYGGSLYAAVDGIPMVMMIRILGKDYILWDKAAHIRFLKPGRGTVYTTITIPKEETEEIKALVERDGKCERLHLIQWFDEEGKLVCDIEQVIYIRKR